MSVNEALAFFKIQASELTQDNLKKVYRKFVKVYHPDKERGNAQTFQKGLDFYNELLAYLDNPTRVSQGVNQTVAPSSVARWKPVGNIFTFKKEIW